MAERPGIGDDHGKVKELLVRLFHWFTSCEPPPSDDFEDEEARWFWAIR